MTGNLPIWSKNLKIIGKLPTFGTMIILIAFPLYFACILFVSASLIYTYQSISSRKSTQKGFPFNGECGCWKGVRREI